MDETTINFVMNLLATAFGVFLGLWTSSLREKYVEKRNQKRLFQSSFIEIVSVVDGLTSIKNGILNGSLKKLLQMPESQIIKMNANTQFPLAEKLINELRPNGKIENEIYYLLLQNHSNIKRLSRSIENITTNNPNEIQNIINSFQNEALRFVWNLKCFFNNKLNKFSEAEIVEMIKSIKEKKM